ETFFNRRDKFFWHVTTFYGIHEFQTNFSFLSRFKRKYDISKFTTTPRLFFVNLSVVCNSCDCFFILNLWLTLVNFNFEFATQTVNKYIQVKFTHSRNNSLSGSFVRTYLECWIFLGKF